MLRSFVYLAIAAILALCAGYDAWVVYVIAALAVALLLAGEPRHDQHRR